MNQLMERHGFVIGKLKTLLGRRPRSWVPLIVLILGAAALLLLATTEWIHGHNVSGQQNLLALNRIQTKIAISHLWVEEFVTGDIVDIDKISGNLEQSELLLSTIEKNAPKGLLLLERSERESASATVANARLALAEFAEISRRRIKGTASGQDVGIGSTIDIQFDAVFSIVLTDLRTLEHVYQKALDLNDARASVLLRAVVITWLLIVGLAVSGLRHRERRRIEAERALLESESQLLQSQKMDAVGRLAGGIAHDINNHLAAMTMQCEVVKLKAADGDPIIQRMDSIMAIGAKSADLIKRLLAFSRRQPVQPEVFSLQRIVKGMQKMLGGLIGEDIQLRVHCADDPWNVLMDPSQMEQILLNLIINARDAMPSGGEIRVSIQNRLVDPESGSENSDSIGDFVVLTVADQGSGIPGEILDRIYEPYFTTKDISSSSGLGLATVHGIVTQNNGHIRVESEQGRGTVFEIFLPRNESAEDEESKQGSIAARQAKESSRILLVEDNEELCEATCEILGELGYKVLTASNGEQALEIFEKANSGIDLVVTDIVMPGMGGKELADQLHRRQPGLPIIFVSGYTDDVMLRHGVEAGEVDFLAKPYKSVELARIVNRLLRQA